MYTAESVVPQMQDVRMACVLCLSDGRNTFQLDVNPYDKLYDSQYQPEYDQTFEYYPTQSTFIRQPVRLFISSPSTRSQYLITSFFLK